MATTSLSTILASLSTTLSGMIPTYAGSSANDTFHAFSGRLPEDEEPSPEFHRGFIWRLRSGALGPHLTTLERSMEATVDLVVGYDAKGDLVRLEKTIGSDVEQFARNLEAVANRPTSVHGIFYEGFSVERLPEGRAKANISFRMLYQASNVADGGF